MTTTSRRRRTLKLAAGFSLPLSFVTETIALLAIKGAGKTYAFLKFAEELIRAGQPVVIVDHVGVCWGLRSSADGKGPGLKVYVLGGEHGDAPLEPHAGKLVADWIVRARVPVILDLSQFTTATDEQRFVGDFADALYRKNRQAIHVMIDEADEFAPQKPMGAAKQSKHAIEMLVRRGRARGIGITMATQRPAVLNKDVLTQASTLLFGRVIGPQDRAAVKLWLAGQTSAHDVDRIVDGLPGLKRGEFHIWAPSHGVFELITIGQRDTFDSSATPKAGQRRRAPKRSAVVDLSKLTADMQAARERQTASDPSKLKAQVAKLERELVAAKAATPTQPPRIIQPPKVIKVRAITDRERARLIAIDAKLKAANRTIDQYGNAYGTVLQAILSRLKDNPHATDERVSSASREQTRIGRRNVVTTAAPATTRQRRRVPEHENRPQTSSAGTSRSVPADPNTAERMRAAGERAGKALDAMAAGMVPLGGQKLAVLQASCQFGRTNQKQLGVLLGIRAKGSTLRAYCQQLVREGLLEKHDNDYVPTDAGTRAAGDWQPLPSDRAGIVSHWLTELGGQRREIFKMVAESNGTGLTEADIGEQLGIAAKGSTVRAYVQQLVRLGLVEKYKGSIQLSEAIRNA
jgi:ribosomal protein S19E (S16A)